MTAWLISAAFCLVSSGALSAVTGALGVADPTDADAERIKGVAKQLLKRREDSLSAGRLGIWLLLVASGVLWAELVYRWLIPGADWQTVALGVAVASLLVFLYAFLGYQLPQRLGFIRPEKTLNLASPLAYPWMVLLIPVAKLSEKIMNLIMPKPDRGELSAFRQLKRLVGRSGLDIGLEETSMLAGVLDLRRKSAKEVMTPTPAVAKIAEDTSIKDAAERCVSRGHTRLIVTLKGSPFKVAGIVHAADLLNALLKDRDEETVGPLLHPALIVPPSKPLDQLLLFLQHRRHYLAVVVDEYGSMTGIVTIEDILEEVVGEIEDETDPTGGEPMRLENGDTVVAGYMALDELGQYGINLPPIPGVKTVGGYVFSTLGRLPRTGESVSNENYTLRIDLMDGNRVAVVCITPGDQESRDPSP